MVGPALHSRSRHISDRMSDTSPFSTAHATAVSDFFRHGLVGPRASPHLVGTPTERKLTVTDKTEIVNLCRALVSVTVSNAVNAADGRELDAAKVYAAAYYRLTPEQREALLRETIAGMVRHHINKEGRYSFRESRGVFAPVKAHRAAGGPIAAFTHALGGPRKLAHTLGTNEALVSGCEQPQHHSA